jgi:hypothetical protein
MKPVLTLVTALLFTPLAVLHGAEAAKSATPAIDYSKDIQPVLAEHCFHCHGQDEHSRKGKLRLDVREAAFSSPRSDTSRAGYGKRAKSDFLPFVVALKLPVPQPLRSLSIEADGDKKSARLVWFDDPVVEPLPKLAN